VDEAERLSTFLPNHQVHIVDGAGHINTCGTRVDIAALLRNRFPELDGGRTAMKPVAAQATGVEFGLEHRYDEKQENIPPLSLWSKANYRKVHHSLD
jgi:hypothetical protein